jgi:hypothetical protein
VGDLKAETGSKIIALKLNIVQQKYYKQITNADCDNNVRR